MPVHAVHVRAPVLLGHDPVVVPEHAAPLPDRVDGQAQALRVDHDAGGVLVLGLAGRGDLHPLLALPDHQGLAVAGDGQVGDVLGEDGELAVRERPVLQGRRGSLALDARPRGAQHPLLGVAEPDEAAGHGGEMRVVAGDDGEGHQARLDLLEVDAGGRRAVRVLRPGGGVRGRGAGGGLGRGARRRAGGRARRGPRSRAARRTVAGALVRGAGGAVGRRLLRRGAPAVGVRAEGVGGGALERQQEGPLGVDEPEVEDHVVVDRLEGAQAQQRQVLAVGAERGGGVLELPGGESAAGRLLGLGVRDHQARELPGVRLGPHQPAAVRRPGQVADLAAAAAADLAHVVQARRRDRAVGVGLPAGVPARRGVRSLPVRLLGGVLETAQGHQAHHVVVADDRDAGAVGRGDGVQDPAHLAHGQADLLAAAVQPRQRQHVGADAALLTIGEGLRIGDEQGEGGAAERPHLPQPQPAGPGEQPRRTAAMGEGVRGAAPLDDARARVVQGPHGQQVLARRGGARQSGGADAGGEHLDFPRCGLEGVHREEAPAGAEHDRASVGRGLAQVALLGGEGGVGAQVRAVGGDGPQVRRGAIGERRAGAGGVGGEQQPVPVPGDPQLRGEDLVEQRLPGASSMRLGGRVQRDVLAREPQLHGRAALVVLPGRLVAAPRRRDHGGAGGMDRDLAAAAQRQQRGGALKVDGPQLGIARDRRGVAGHRDDAAVGQPADDLRGGAAPEGQAARRGLAGDVRDPHLRPARGAGGEGDAGAVGGEARVGDGGALVGEAPGAASLERGEPHVVRGGEGDQLAPDVGVAEISGMSRRRRHGFHPMPRGRRRRAGALGAGGSLSRARRR